MPDIKKLKQLSETLKGIANEKKNIENEEKTSVDLAMKISMHDETINALNQIREDRQTISDSVSQIKEAISQIKIDAPVIPEIKMPEIPKTEVNIDTAGIRDEIKKGFAGIKIDTPVIPEPKINIKVPTIETPVIPPIKIPDVNVNVDLPDEMNIKGDVGLRDISVDNPIPVKMVDEKGRPVNFGGGSSSVGNFGKIIGQQTNGEQKTQIVDSDGSNIGFSTSAKQDDLLTELQGKLESVSVSALTVSLVASGNILDPAAGKKIRIYNLKFSLSADITDVSFRWGSGGTDFAKYLAPKTGGFYGTNLHSDYIEGATDAILYCAITGAGTVQINLEYIEI